MPKGRKPPKPKPQAENLEKLRQMQQPHRQNNKGHRPAKIGQKRGG